MPHGVIIATLVRFQAQTKWEMSVKGNSARAHHIDHTSETEQISRASTQRGTATPMTKRYRTSRQQFDRIKAEFHRAKSQSHGGRSPRRYRSSFALIRSFNELLRGHRGSVAFSLSTLTIATLLALIPPAATKFVVDYVLGGRPLPDSVPDWLPHQPWPLLLLITAGVLAISLVKTGMHIWSRWHATRVTKLIQMSVRKQVFTHAMRLPLHRAEELKSGGAASILRQDAGSVGELIFGMFYNPWRRSFSCSAVYAFWRGLTGGCCWAP